MSPRLGDVCWSAFVRGVDSSKVCWETYEGGIHATLLSRRSQHQRSRLTQIGISKPRLVHCRWHDCSSWGRIIAVLRARCVLGLHGLTTLSNKDISTELSGLRMVSQRTQFGLDIPNEQDPILAYSNFYSADPSFRMRGCNFQSFHPESGSHATFQSMYRQSVLDKPSI